MTEEEAARLARLARSLDLTESEVLRKGLSAIERDEQRSNAWDELIKMAEEAGPEPPKPRWRSP